MECAVATMNYKFITVISKNVLVLILGRVIQGIQHGKYFEFFITQNEFLIKRYTRPYKVMKILKKG
jgi:predicted MFS family arabinose efflux permease